MSESFIYRSLVKPQSITGRTWQDMRKRGSTVACTALGGDKTVAFDIANEDVIRALSNALRELLDNTRTGTPTDVSSFVSRHDIATIVVDELRPRDGWEAKERFRLRQRETVMGNTTRVLIGPGEVCGFGVADE